VQGAGLRACLKGLAPQRREREYLAIHRSPGSETGPRRGTKGMPARERSSAAGQLRRRRGEGTKGGRYVAAGRPAPPLRGEGSNEGSLPTPLRLP
jgi:hypothetical protein